MTYMTQGGNMSKEIPESFNDLDVAELRRTAVEDFAVDIKATDNKKTVLAALVEDGVEWEQYATLKGLNVPEPEPVVEAAPEVETADATIPEPEVEIITATALAPSPVQKYLIRMERDNVRYDTRGYKFTQEHPYALVNADDANYILEKEIGFRMATPRELEEFYG
jgi:hypothetical protein